MRLPFASFPYFARPLLRSAFRALVIVHCSLAIPLAARVAASFPVEEISISDLRTAYTSGRATAREVTQAHIDRIAAYDRSGPMLGAIIALNPAALADADKLDAAFKSTGKLTGPPAPSSSRKPPCPNGRAADSTTSTPSSRKRDDGHEVISVIIWEKLP